MVAGGSGHIVTVASAAGLMGSPRMTDYSASKFAAVGFNEALRLELKRSAPGVKTTVVCPFYIDTGMFEGVRTRFPLLLPILREEEVVGRVLKAIQHDRPQVVMPWMVRTLPAMRLLPVGAFDRVADFLRDHGGDGRVHGARRRARELEARGGTRGGTWRRRG